MSKYTVSVDKYVEAENEYRVYTITLGDTVLTVDAVPESFIDNLICGKSATYTGHGWDGKIEIVGEKVVFSVSSCSFLDVKVVADRVKLAAEFAKLRDAAVFFKL